MSRFLRALVAVALAFACIAPALAEAPAKPAASAVEPAEPGVYPDAVTQHSIVIDGKTIPYTATAGTIALQDDEEKPTTRVFYTAFTADGANPFTRPVTFIYNGGPGSSTMWLRMGSFGPVRVVAANGAPTGPPPYRIIENGSSLLDKSDLVFIDMPTAGFGRALPGKEREYYGVDQDGAAFGQFITRYLNKNGRWNSPKFVFGESYGTTRSAVLSNYLLNHGVFLNGIVLLSSILNFSLDYGNGDPIAGGDWPYVFYLPTEAATAWYHNKVPNRPSDLATFLNGVKQFALGEYLSALYKGDKLGAAERESVARRLSYYLGLPTQYVRNANLRVPYGRFQRELLRSQGQVVGRLDGRYETDDLDRSSMEGPEWDPTDSSIDGPYTTAVNQYLRNDLKYNPSMVYRINVYGTIYSDGKSWDFSHNGAYPLNVAGDLATVMTQDPKLKVFSANGYYDFATPFFATDYTLRHLSLNPSVQSNITYGYYESGHMVYLNDASLIAFKADLARWYDSASGR